MSEEWKNKLKKYYNGSLSEEKAKQIENDLERVEVYQEIVSEELGSNSDFKDESPNDLPPEKVSEILKNSIRHARFSLAAYVIMIILLIFPLMMLMSYLYYGWNQKAEDFIQVAIQTVYVTEPNVSLEEMDIERSFGLFTFDVTMNLYKRVGKSDVKQGDWEVSYQFNDATFPKRNYISETPPSDIPYYDTKKLYHPEAKITNRDSGSWETLEKLPDGTVAEVYLSLEQIKKTEDMNEVINGIDVEWRWYAIDTGLEKSGESLEGGYLAPIGYPAQTDTDAWSPYNNRETNQEQFMESLYFLQQYQPQATNIAHAKWLDLDHRINYLEKNGLNSYGGVIIGPAKEILKLKDNELIRTIYVGEVRLWNW